jgi:hypothetical protein
MNPALWRFRRKFALSDFVLELNMSEQSKSFPVLSLFLSKESLYRGLRYLPEFLEFQNLLLNRYAKRLDPDFARFTTIGDVLRTSPEPLKWAAAFDGFAQAWNLTWPNLSKVGTCEDIPEVFKQMVMSHATPLAFCLPAEKDEGLCFVALARFMGERHNELVHAVDELLLMRGEEAQRASTKDNIVSSKQFTQAHAFNYQLSDFLLYIEEQCIQINEAGHVVFDFACAQQYLLDTILMGKPVFELQIRMVSSGAESKIYALNGKVAQEPLPPDVLQSLVKELASPMAIRACLELLENAAAFLQETGGLLAQRLDVGDKLFGAYIATDLLMDATTVYSSLSLGPSCILATQVHLKHLESVAATLQKNLSTDPFERTDPKYKENLTDEMRAVLTIMARMPDTDMGMLLPTIKSYIVNLLKDGAQPASSIFFKNHMRALLS